MRKIAWLLPFAALLALSGCATSYSTEGITGGYDQKQLAADSWRVVFAGNGYTSRETVQTFWLYRAAELTLEKGYDGFEITSRISLASAGGGLIAVQYVEKPSMVADIHLLKKPFTPRPPRVFDAAALKSALEPRVKGQLCDSNVCPHVHTYLMPPL